MASMFVIATALLCIITVTIAIAIDEDKKK